MNEKKNHKSYKCLKVLDQKGIKYIYTPFDQRAIAETLDTNWDGSCAAISSDWMLRKIRQENPLAPTSYEITDPNLPHPVVVQDNTTYPKKVQEHLERYYRLYSPTQSRIDETPGIWNLDTSIQKFLDYVGSKKFHYGYIKTSFLVKYNTMGHATSFVKREDAISFFDPNYGEITFEKFSDFRIWFEEEVKNGALNFIFTTEDHEKKFSSLSDLFTNPTFSEKQKQNKYEFSEKIIAIREKTQEMRSKIKAEKILIVNYAIDSFYGDAYVRPLDLDSIQFFTIYLGDQRNGNANSPKVDVFNEEILDQLLNDDQINPVDKVSILEELFKIIKKNEHNLYTHTNSEKQDQEFTRTQKDHISLLKDGVIRIFRENPWNEEIRKMVSIENPDTLIDCDRNKKFNASAEQNSFSAKLDIFGLLGKSNQKRSKTTARKEIDAILHATSDIKPKNIQINKPIL